MQLPLKFTAGVQHIIMAQAARQGSHCGPARLRVRVSLQSSSSTLSRPRRGRAGPGPPAVQGNGTQAESGGRLASLPVSGPRLARGQPATVPRLAGGCPGARGLEVPPGRATGTCRLAMVTVRELESELSGRLPPDTANRDLPTRNGRLSSLFPRSFFGQEFNDFFFTSSWRKWNWWKARHAALLQT
jgi:hypothetical protein